MKVLITGGAGFLGRGILRRVYAGDLDWEVTVYSRDETKQDECKRLYRNANYILGDVRDAGRLHAALTGHDVVIHAAAMKYIPEGELNASEAISINVDGSRNVLAAAASAGVSRVVGISTDKACQPVNVYGATKMVMERLYAETSQYPEAFPFVTCVRYGNVVGSTGSVIPLFQRQFKEEGRVKITSDKMSRFWMSINDAIDLVLIALSNKVERGAVVVPYASGMSLVNVARAATVEDVPIEYIGERPGEKHHEALIHFEESVRVVRHTHAERPFYELLSPHWGSKGERPFTLISSSPPHWMTLDEMKAAIVEGAGL